MVDGIDRGHARAVTRTALVVAADPDRRDALGRELASAGLDPLLAADGKQAEQQAGAALPDALVLDQGMPGLALFRLYSALRGLPGGADVPIFFVGQTGTDTPTDHYLPAGLSLGEVADRVRDEARLLATTVGPAAAPAGVDPIAPIGADPLGTPAVEPALPHKPSDIGAAPDAGVPMSAATTIGAEAPPAEDQRTMPSIERPIASDRHAVRASGPGPTPVPPPVVVPGLPGAPADPTPVEPADSAPVAEDRAPVQAGAQSRIARRDVVLLRVGLVLLLLGGAVLLLRPDSSTQPIAPPTLATATPATKPTPPPSPSPAAVAPGR